MKSVTIPAINQSYYEKMEKSEIGKQKYWYDLLLGDVEVGKKRLVNIMQFPETAEELTKNESAMQLIIDGKTNADDRDKEIIIGDKENFAQNNWLVHYTVPDDRILILTKHIGYNASSSSTRNCQFKINKGTSIINVNLEPNKSNTTNLNHILRSGDSISIYSYNSDLKHTIKGILIDLSLTNVFLDGKYSVGAGLANKFDKSLNALSTMETFHDILYSINAMNDICNNDNIMNFLDKFVHPDRILTNKTSVAKWIAKKGNYNPNNYNNIADMHSIIKNLLNNTSTYNLCKNYIFSNEEFFNNLLSSKDIEKLTLMHNRQFLIKTPFLQVGSGHYANTQYSHGYNLGLSGSTSSYHYACFYSNQRFDLTNIKKITFNFDVATIKNKPYVYMGINTNNAEGTNGFILQNNKQYTTTISNQQFVLDTTSIKGMHYLKFLIMEHAHDIDDSGTIIITNIIFSK